ncbi:MAG: hypothetical protein ABSA97_09510 [Verrucomicrobiia bacterium]
MKHLLYGAVLVAAFSVSAAAQILKPLDPGKRADDINNKSVNFGNVNLRTISTGMRQTTRSSLSDKNAHFNGVNLSDVELRLLNLSDVQMKTLPQQNFTAKRAVLPDKVPPQEQLGLIHTKAPIKDRQIRAFTPAGEEELKKQLHDIPPPQPAEKAQSPASSGK